VEKLGTTWVVIGWILALLNLAGLILAFAAIAPFFTEMAASSADTTAIQGRMQASPLWLLMNILSYGTWFGILLWTIFDLIDRKGNFIWLLPQVLCTCCGFGWLILPIYILAGRK
jgi:hypothetical protein